VVRSSQYGTVISTVPVRVQLRLDSLASAAKGTLELVEYTVVLVQVTELLSEMVMDVDRLDWLALHCSVPDLECQVIPRQNVFSVLGELDIRNGRDDFGKERFLGRILLFLKHCLSAQSGR
jgi:hypothetical protein